MKVRIDTGGREVEIECADVNVSPKDIAAEALAVWQATEGAKGSAGPAVGRAGPQLYPHCAPYQDQLSITQRVLPASRSVAIPRPETPQIPAYPGTSSRMVVHAQ